MISSYSPLPRRCPVGFQFEYEGHVWSLVRWTGTTPEFVRADDPMTGELRWSGAMETKAAEAFHESDR